MCGLVYERLAALCFARFTFQEFANCLKTASFVSKNIAYEKVYNALAVLDGHFPRMAFLR